MAGFEARMAVDPKQLEPIVGRAVEEPEDTNLTQHYQMSVAMQARKRQSDLYPISGSQQKLRDALQRGQKSGPGASSARPPSASEVSSTWRSSVPEEVSSARRPSSSRASSARRSSTSSEQDRGFYSHQKGGITHWQRERRGSQGSSGPGFKRTRATLHAFAGAMALSFTEGQGDGALPRYVTLNNA